MYIHYRSISDMNEDLLRNLHKFPHDIDLIVGIPRSGMLPANLLALYLNKPFTDIDSFIDGRTYSSGERGVYIEDVKSQKVLVIDDSLRSGNALGKAKVKLEPFIKRHAQIQCLFGVVYATKENCGMVDFFCENIDGERVFQWNIFHHPIIKKSAFDIDGVLCPNPPVDDDGPQYLEYIYHAPLLYKPTLRINTLVSCRLEKYRQATEHWLKENGIQYNNLVMLNLKTKAERQQWGKHGQYKAQVYHESDDVLFVESSLVEAKQMQQYCSKPIFCIETFSMLNDESILNKYGWNIKIKTWIAKLVGSRVYNLYKVLKGRSLF